MTIGHLQYNIQKSNKGPVKRFYRKKNIIFLSFVQDNYPKLIKYEKKYETDILEQETYFSQKH